MEKTRNLKWKSHYYKVRCLGCKREQKLSMQEFENPGTITLYLKAQCEGCEVLFHEADGKKLKANFEILERFVRPRNRKPVEILPPAFFDTSDDSVFSIKPNVPKK